MFYGFQKFIFFIKNLHNKTKVKFYDNNLLIANKTFMVKFY